jgi:hypothetical protein
MEKFYTDAKWCAKDVHAYRKRNGLPQWNDEQANQWLSNNETKIEDVMVEAGWLCFEEMG